MIDRAAVARGDTIIWRLRGTRRGTGKGLVTWTTPAHVHVESDARRYAIPWERVTEHYPGRAEYDRRYGGHGVTRRQAGLDPAPTERKGTTVMHTKTTLTALAGAALAAAALAAAVAAGCASAAPMTQQQARAQVKSITAPLIADLGTLAADASNYNVTALQVTARKVSADAKQAATKLRDGNWPTSYQPKVTRAERLLGNVSTCMDAVASAHGMLEISAVISQGSSCQAVSRVTGSGV